MSTRALRVLIDTAVIALEVCDATNDDERETVESVEHWVAANPLRITEMLTEAIIEELAQ